MAAKRLPLNYDSGSWTLADDPDYHLDASACNTMVTALASLNAKRQPHGSARRRLRPCRSGCYGHGDGGRQRRTPLPLAPRTRSPGDLYVQKAGDDAVYTVSGNKAACFEQTKADLFGAFNPAGLTASALRRFPLRRAAAPLHRMQSLNAGSGDDRALKARPIPPPIRPCGGWPMNPLPIGRQQVAEHPSALAGYVTAQIADADPSAYGFDAPLATVAGCPADGTVTLHYAEKCRRLLDDGGGGQFRLCG